MVHTTEGLIPIEECIPGMSLLQCNEATMEVCTTEIRNVYDNGVQSVFKIVSGSGDIILATADHKFLFHEGWMPLAEAAGLDLDSDNPVATKFPQFNVLGEDGDIYLAKTLTVEFAGNVQVYDIEVTSDYSNFICEGYVVSNSKPVALEPIGQEGGYHFFGPPADGGFSYGLFSDGENTIASQMSPEVYSPYTGALMSYQGPVSYEDVQKAMSASRFSKLLHSCADCSYSYVTSADHANNCHCPACGSPSAYGSALMRGRNSRK